MATSDSMASGQTASNEISIIANDLNALIKLKTFEKTSSSLINHDLYGFNEDRLLAIHYLLAHNDHIDAKCISIHDTGQF